MLIPPSLVQTPIVGGPRQAVLADGPQREQRVRRSSAAPRLRDGQPGEQAAEALVPEELLPAGHSAVAARQSAVAKRKCTMLISQM